MPCFPSSCIHVRVTPPVTSKAHPSTQCTNKMRVLFLLCAHGASVLVRPSLTPRLGGLSAYNCGRGPISILPAELRFESKGLDASFLIKALFASSDWRTFPNALGPKSD